MKLVKEGRFHKGLFGYRLEGMPDGMFIEFPTRIDLLIGLLENQLQDKRMAIFRQLGIDASGVTRTRIGEHGLPDHWIMRASDLSGMSINEIRTAMSLNPLCHSHPNARKPD